MKYSIKQSTGFTVFACLLPLTLAGCNLPGGASNEELNGLKTQVASLERDVTQLKQMFQSMTSVLQQQEATIRTLTNGGKKVATTAAPAAKAPAKPAAPAPAPAKKKSAHR